MTREEIVAQVVSRALIQLASQHASLGDWRRFLVLGTILLVVSTACTTVEEPLRADLQRSDVEQCAAWFVRLDDAIDRSGVRDAEAYRVPGYPYLRVNRFLASFHDRVAVDPAAFSVWEQHLRDLDGEARSSELSNLPAPALASLGTADRSSARLVTDRCATILAIVDLSTSAGKQTVIERASVPDDYADWKRAIGLYPIIRWPFLKFARDWEEQALGMFRVASLRTTKGHHFVRYEPPAPAMTEKEMADVFSRVKRDVLGIPEFSRQDRLALFTTFAPVFEIDTNGDYDRIGPLQWTGGEAPAVDISRPTVYRRLAFTRYGTGGLVQVVYSVWFPERPKTKAIDPVSGTLDGLTFRVTLDPYGHPLVYDSIHNCGCYHMFFPTPRVTSISSPDQTVEWVFVPKQLPIIDAPQRVLVRVTSGDHYVTEVDPETGGHGHTYTLVNDAELRTLPVSVGTRSAFGPGGIVPGTDRGERFVTWMLGLDDAGAMRVWGHHATALVGRRQFDDADLIEQRFAIVDPAATNAAQLR
jgi:hypothetical protein